MSGARTELIKFIVAALLVLAGLVVLWWGLHPLWEHVTPGTNWHPHDFKIVFPVSPRHDSGVRSM